MSSHSQLPTIQSDLSDRTLTINLILKAPQIITVRSCEVLGRGFRNRLSFQGESDLDKVLHARLAQSIRECLRSVPDGAQVLSMPEFLLELPGLALYGAHVLVMDARNGIRNAILRFTEFLGAASNAFIPEIGFDQATTTHSEKLAMNVLEEICMPILNLCHALDTMAQEQGQPVPARVRDRAREFQFQTELLKRFVCNAKLTHADAPFEYLGSTTGPAKLSPW